MGAQKTAEPLLHERLWGFVEAIANSRWIFCKRFMLTAGDFDKGRKITKGNGK